MRILCSICGAEAWGFAQEQEVYRLPVPLEGGPAKQSQGLHKMPWGMGKVSQAQAVQQSAESCPHTRVFVVSQQVALSRLWDLCGAPLPGRLSPEREAAGVIARYRCCVSS